MLGEVSLIWEAFNYVNNILQFLVLKSNYFKVYPHIHICKFKMLSMSLIFFMSKLFQHSLWYCCSLFWLSKYSLGNFSQHWEILVFQLSRKIFGEQFSSKQYWQSIKSLYHHMPLKTLTSWFKDFSNLEWGNFDMATLFKSSKGQSQKDHLGREIMKAEGE